MTARCGANPSNANQYTRMSARWGKNTQRNENFVYFLSTCIDPIQKSPITIAGTTIREMRLTSVSKEVVRNL